eukprot:377236-Pyramimonas_sp.AAC.1
MMWGRRIAPHRRFIGNSSAMHWRRRRCIGDVGGEEVGFHVEPPRRCSGDASRCSGPICSNPLWEA